MQGFHRYIYVILIDVIIAVLCGNLYFVKEVHIKGGKQFDHNTVVALCTDNFNIYRESLSLYSSLHFFFFTLSQRWKLVGDLGSDLR